MVNEDTKIQDSDNDSVSHLLGTLNRVEAPNDFNFRVKARIAKGRPVDRQYSWLPASFRYAVPLVLLLAVGGYVGFRSIGSSQEANAVVVAAVPAVEVVSLPVIVPQSLEVVTPSVEPVAAQVNNRPSELVDKETKTPQKAPIKPAAKIEKPEGGSFVVAGSQAITIRPRDVDDLAAPTPRKTLVSSSEFLSLAGITASSAGAGGRIQSVAGQAANAGIKVGDVIESVNVQTGTVRVRRDGKVIAFSIK